MASHKRRLREAYTPHGIKVDDANFVDINESDLGENSSLITKSPLTKAELAQIAGLLQSKVDPDAVKLVWLKSDIEQDLGGVPFGYTVDGGWCFINTNRLKQTAADGGGAIITFSNTAAHEFGHALFNELYKSHKDGDIALPLWHLMANRGGNGISPIFPDSSGKHLFVKDTAICQSSPFAKPISP